MLSKETLKYLSLKLLRSPMGAESSHALKIQAYRIKIPKDKLDLLVGAVLKNRYFVLSILGKGGMSLVYRAKDMQTNSLVAVKALRTQGMGDEILVKRFRLEAEVLHRLNHPRIVSVHDYGTSSHGQPFFIMDYLTGVSLNQVLKYQGPLKPERFQDIFVQVAAAIAYAHKHGAIHRDVKPGNIMLVEMAGTKDYVKIVDFGIAKLAEDATKLTRMGEVWGSPIYMSPEQGMGTTIDARTDIYSLGVVMYEALTGEVPFLGRNYVETMTMQISEPPAPFSDLVPDMKIPAALEMIVFRALQKAPDERYQSMTEMKSDLEKALNTGQVRTPESTGSRPVWGFVKKKVEKTIAEEKAMAVPLSHPEPESEDEITKHIIRGVADPDIVSAAAPQIQDFHPGTAPEPSNQENSGSKGEEARQRHKNLIQKTTPTIIESFIESFQPDYQAPTEQEVKARSGGPEESDKTKPEIQDSRTPKRLRAQTRSNRTTGSQRMPRDTSTRNKRSRQSEKPSIFKGLFFKIMVIAAVAGIAYGVLASPELQQALVDFIYKTDWGEKPGSQESLD